MSSHICHVPLGYQVADPNPYQKYAEEFWLQLRGDDDQKLVESCPSGYKPYTPIHAHAPEGAFLIYVPLVPAMIHAGGINTVLLNALIISNLFFKCHPGVVFVAASRGQFCPALTISISLFHSHNDGTCHPAGHGHCLLYPSAVVSLHQLLL